MNTSYSNRQSLTVIAVIVTVTSALVTVTVVASNVGSRGGVGGAGLPTMLIDVDVSIEAAVDVANVEGADDAGGGEGGSGGVLISSTLGEEN